MFNMLEKISHIVGTKEVPSSIQLYPNVLVYKIVVHVQFLCTIDIYSPKFIRINTFLLLGS